MSKKSIKRYKGRFITRKLSNIKYYIFRGTTYLFLLDMAFVFGFPFLYMIVTSVKNAKDLYDFTVNWIPRSVEFRNYILAYRILQYPVFFKNSFIITTMTTIGHLLSCSFIGYGFARYNFKGKNIFFSIAILSIIIPIQTIIVPQYMIFSNFNWLNTYLPMIIPTFSGYGLKGGLFIFIFRQYYLGLPTALEDAAKIDGCNYLRTYWNIVLPIAKSAFMVTSVLSLVWHWNDFYEPSIYISLPNLYTLPSRLNAIVARVNQPTRGELFAKITQIDAESAINNAVLMAGTFMVTLPILLSFMFLQKQFMQGIERTGLVE